MVFSPHTATQTLPESKGIRLFQSNLLEALTHVHPIVPLCLWGPLAVMLIGRGVLVHGHDWSDLGVMLFTGLLAWTLGEYLVHRFVFHFSPTTDMGRYLVYLFHGIHHDDPNDRTRLVMPPAGAILIIGTIYVFFSLLIPHPWIEPFFGFFIIGYLAYDYTHYAIHFWPMRGRIGAYIKRNHLLHHFQESEARFGVSSPLWDFVFGSRGKLPTSPQG